MNYKEVAEEIKTELKNMGVEEEKIIWEQVKERGYSVKERL